MVDLSYNIMKDEEEDDFIPTPLSDAADPNTDKDVVEEELGIQERPRVSVPTTTSTRLGGLGSRPAPTPRPEVQRQPQGEIPVEQPVVSQQSGEKSDLRARYEAWLNGDNGATPVAEEPRTAVPGVPVETYRVEGEEKVDESVPEYLRLETYNISEVEPGSYSENDLIENDYLFNQIKPYMVDRYGSDFIEESSREEVINKFLNENRSAAIAGNGWTVGSRITYLSSLGDDDEKLLNAGKAFAVYENMANVFGDDLTAGERWGIVWDSVRSGILDPVNLVTLGPLGKAISKPVAKLLGTTTTKAVGNRMVAAALRAQQSAFQREIAKGATREVAQTISQKEAASVFRAAEAKLASETASSIAANAVVRRAATSGNFKALVNRSTIADVAGVVGADALYSVGAEALYQKSLVDTGVQEGYSASSLGLAFVGSLVMGGVVSGGIAARSITSRNARYASEEIKFGKPDDALKNLNKSLSTSTPLKESDVVPSAKPVTRTSTLGEQAKRGKVATRELELEDLDAEFFTSLISGIDRVTPEGNKVPVTKGLAQALYENGQRFVKLHKDDKITAWISDVIRESSPSEVRKLVDNLERVRNITIKNKSDITPDKFADLLSSRTQDSAKLMNSLSQTFRNVGIDTSDFTKQDLMKSQMGNLSKKISEKIEKAFGETMADITKNFQNRMIRLLVSHPGTSYLNLVGWAGNTALSSVSDIALATVHAGVGAVARIGGLKNYSNIKFDQASGLLKTTFARSRFLFDPNLTKTQFDSYGLLAGKDFKSLRDVQSGGVDIERAVNFSDGKSIAGKLAGLKMDSAVDFAQRISFVQAQDTFTKSQEFMYQLDRALRQGIELTDSAGKKVTKTFKGGYAEFMDTAKNPDLRKILFSSDWRKVEAGVVDRTLEAIFSKSYKGKGTLGEVATLIEDMRNIPGLGMLVPFGRFFNNTMSFMFTSSGLGAIGKLAGFYKNRSYGEQFMRAAVSLGLVYTMAESENELRKQGIPAGFGISRTTGEVIDQRYDFPISLFKYAARIIGYRVEGEEVPKDILTEAGQLFGITGVLRNLTDTQTGTAEIFRGLASGEMEQVMDSLQNAAGAVSSQMASAGTRWLEPYNVGIGLARGPEYYYTPDMREGNKYINQSFRYVDQLANVLLGRDKLPERVDAAGGRVEVQPTKTLGLRPVQLSNTQRVMAMLGIPDYKLNIPSGVADRAPAAARNYNRLFNEYLERESEGLLDRGFSSWPQDAKEARWTDVVQEGRRLVQSQMFLDSPENVALHYQLKLQRDFSRDELSDAIREIFPEGKEVHELTPEEARMIDNYMSVKEFNNKVRYY